MLKYTVSLHDALPIFERAAAVDYRCAADELPEVAVEGAEFFLHGEEGSGVLDGGSDFQAVADDAVVRHQLPHADRKSTRLNSSHLVISYAVFGLKEKE